MAILIFGEFHYYYEDAKPKNLALACSLQLLMSLLLFDLYASVIQSILCV